MRCASRGAVAADAWMDAQFTMQDPAGWALHRGNGGGWDVRRASLRDALSSGERSAVLPDVGDDVRGKGQRPDVNDSFDRHVGGDLCPTASLLPHGRLSSSALISAPGGQHMGTLGMRS